MSNTSSTTNGSPQTKPKSGQPSVSLNSPKQTEISSNTEVVSKDFRTLPIGSAILEAIDSLGFSGMTDTQAAVVPSILKGSDVAVQAKTGSGKTLAFALGILSRIDADTSKVQALVLCPTRELAEQVAEQIRNLAKRIANTKVITLVGGMPLGSQAVSLRYGANVVVGTPGRIMDHISKRTLSLKKVNCFVLDEADRMLDMGFEDEMRIIMRQLPNAELGKRQTMLFSATFPPFIEELISKYQYKANIIKVVDVNKTQAIQQQGYKIEGDRSSSVAALLTLHQPNSCIVFCRTKIDTQKLADTLVDLGFSAVGLHGDLTQPERSQVLARFANKSTAVMVATDVAARGLDIDKVDLVINHDVSDDADTHVHRVGRTGRGEETGIALTLFTAAEEDKLDEIAARTDATIERKNIMGVRFHANRIKQPEFGCVLVDGGKRDKLRPGDILGALTQDAGINSEDIGKIHIVASHSYIAIKVRSVKRAINQFREGKIKNKRFKARKL